MARVKERKIYGVNNFRGLDKENKHLKVAPFRATDGENFIIDSDTLKTRPGFTYYKTPIKNMEEGEYILDVYNFRGTELIITNTNIYFDGESNTSRLITNIPGLKNFHGKKPLFQEEKDSLFIFGLNMIMIFSVIYKDEKEKFYVLYDLKNKVENPFDINDEKEMYDLFEDLPKPYEPTIFIGDKPFDDINLLSNVTKYELFGYTNSIEQDTINTHYLPTHYDEEKHGKIKAVDINFYKDSFGEMDAIPFFKGIVGDFFVLDGKELEDFGVLLNDDNPVEIANVYYPLNDFQMYATKNASGELEDIEVISEEINLMAKDFFEMITKESGQNIHQYLLDYIKMNPYDEYKNRLLTFEITISVNVKYMDKDDKSVIKIVKENVVKKVYVQLYKYEMVNTGYEHIETLESDILNSSVVPPIYAETPPIYPEGSSIFNYNLTPFPIKKDNFSVGDFNDMVRSKLIEESKNENFIDGSIVVMRGIFYSEKNNFSKPVISNIANNIENTSRYYDLDFPIPEFPNYPTRSGFPITDFSINLSENKYGSGFISITRDSNTNWDLEEYEYGMLPGQNNEIEIRKKVQEELQRIFDEDDSLLPNDEGYGEVKYRISYFYKLFDNPSRPNERVAKISRTSTFRYKKGTKTTITTSQGYASSYKVIKDGGKNIMNDLYEFNFNKDRNAFELKVKNYFYDFNNVPSIDVKITFEKNPDYEYISNSKFGITFGSENRLFLAGNEEFPNIDRYNVSNDLLGNLVTNQSYELSYFPSKNYRVLGGKGKINSYVIATDTQLYITKEAYPNDEKFFIRERMLDENGVVGYKEYKTSINKTSINNNTIVRFYNDMLVLDESGLFSIEISSNVLTNERLVKMRSGFINDDLMKDIRETNKDEIFIYEDNNYMYIFVGKNIYVADSRYLANNENAEVGNYNYEIVKWISPVKFKSAKLIDGKILLIDEVGQNLYTIEKDKNIDELSAYQKDLLIGTNFNRDLKGQIFISNVEKDELEYVNFVPNNDLYNTFATSNVVGVEDDFILEEGSNKKFIVLNDYNFRNIKDGDVLYINVEYETGSYTVTATIKDLEKSDREYFSFVENYNINANEEIILSKNVKGLRLYPNIYIRRNDGVEYVALTQYKPFEIEEVIQHQYEDDTNFFQRINMLLNSDNSFMFYKDTYTSGNVSALLPIKMRWVSALFDFDNQFYEKTMFKTMLYGTKQYKENKVYIGYKTMRRLDRFDTPSISQDLSNNFDFENVDFDLYAISTFNEFGSSIPTKENNFLYIQFVIFGEGNIEINGINFLYKNNRMIKTIG